MSGEQFGNYSGYSGGSNRVTQYLRFSLLLFLTFFFTCKTTPPEILPEIAEQSAHEITAEPVPSSQPAPAPPPVITAQPAIAEQPAPVTQVTQSPPVNAPVRETAPVQPPAPERRTSDPVIVASPYQEVLYNSAPRQINARSIPELPLIITYYKTRDDYSFMRNGFYDPPVEPGYYYVTVNCARGYGYNEINDTLVEFRIKKAPVKITGDAVQSAVYNGNPRRVQVTAEPEVPLSYSYYPDLETRQAALIAFFNPETGEQPLATALQRFRRVESAPAEQGTYYVLVYFYGNERYEPAYREIDFTIGPPARRN